MVKKWKLQVAQEYEGNESEGRNEASNSNEDKTMKQQEDLALKEKVQPVEPPPEGSVGIDIFDEPEALVDRVRGAVDNYARIFVFQVENIKSNKLKTVRDNWSHSKFFIGKNRVMAKALGNTEEEEYSNNLHLVAKCLENECGLLVTNQSQDEVKEYFNNLAKPDFARTGGVAAETVVLKEGPLLMFRHNMELQLRQLGLPVQLVKGQVMMLGEHTVATKGEVLTSEQARILKLLGYEQAKFKMNIVAGWNKEDGKFTVFSNDTSTKAFGGISGDFEGSPELNSTLGGISGATSINPAFLPTSGGVSGDLESIPASTQSLGESAHPVEDTLLGRSSLVNKSGHNILPMNAIVSSKTVIRVDTPGCGANKRKDSETSDDDSDLEERNLKTIRPKVYMTKHRRLQKKKHDKEIKRAQCNKAVAAVLRGKFNVSEAAKHYKVPRTTLRDIINRGDEFQGSGKKLKCLTFEEEQAIVGHVRWKAGIGCGVNWQQLQSLIHEVLLGIKIANPNRMTGYEESGQVPNMQFVRRLAERHNLTLRRSSEISKGNI